MKFLSKITLAAFGLVLATGISGNAQAKGGSYAIPRSINESKGLESAHPVQRTLEPETQPGTQDTAPVLSCEDAAEKDFADCMEDAEKTECESNYTTSMIRCVEKKIAETVNQWKYKN